jgi:hypothetical protein
VSIETKEVQEVLFEVLQKIAGNKELQRSIEDYLIDKHNMIFGTFIELVANPNKADMLDDEDIMAIANAIYNVGGFAEINPNLFFSERELRDLEYHSFQNEEELSFPITFKPVIRVTDEDYLLSLSYKELAALDINGLLTYNFETQRLAKITTSKRTGDIIKKKNIKSASVKNIMRLMKEGKYSPSTLLFNVLVDGESQISYSEGELTIHKGSTMNIIDGAHRLEAIVRIIEEDPNFEGYMNVDLKHYPLLKAQKLLAVTNTVNAFDKTHVKYLGGEELGQEIAKYLISLPVLKDRVSTKTSVSKKGQITNFAILSEAIEESFNPTNPKEKYDAQEVLERFYGYLIPSYEKELVKERAKYLDITWLSHHNMHVGFVAIAKKLFDKYGKNFPVDKIVEIVDAIDFKKETSKLNTIMSGQGKTNSNAVKKQIQLFIETEADRILGKEA